MTSSPFYPPSWIAQVAPLFESVAPQIHTVTEAPGCYLAFRGCIAPEKGFERAAEIARRSEIPLKIAAKMDRTGQAYCNPRNAHLIEGSLVDFIGEINEVEKTRFLGDVNCGFIVDDLDTAVACVARAHSLNRKRCREVFEQRFQVAQMSQGYCDVYELVRQQTCPVMS